LGSAGIVAAALAGAVLVRFLVASALAFAERKLLLLRHRASVSQTLHVPEAADDIVYVELVSLDTAEDDAKDIIRVEVGDHILLRDEAGVRSSMEGTGHSWNSTRPACVGKEWVITAMRTPEVFNVPGSPFEWPLGSIQEVLSSTCPGIAIRRFRYFCNVDSLAWKLQHAFAKLAGLAVVVAGITLTAYAHKMAVGAMCVPDGKVEWLGGRAVLSWCTALAAACACCSYLLTGCSRALGRLLVWPLLILAAFTDCVLVSFLWRDVVARPAHHILRRDLLGLLLHVLLQVPHSACLAFFIGPFWAAVLLPAVSEICRPVKTGGQISEDWEDVVRLSPYVFVPALVAALPFATFNASAVRGRRRLAFHGQQPGVDDDLRWSDCLAMISDCLTMGECFTDGPGDKEWRFFIRSSVFSFVYYGIYWRVGVMDFFVNLVDLKNRFNYQRHPLVAPLCSMENYGTAIVLYTWVLLVSAASCSMWLRPYVGEPIRRWWASWELREARRPEPEPAPEPGE
jgi:hypothetical protein